MNKVDLFLIFHHKNHAALNKLGSGGSLAELDAARGANTVADSEYCFQIVVFALSVNLPFSFLANYPEFPDS